MSDPNTNFSTSSGEGYELQMGRFSRLLAARFLDFFEVRDAGTLLDAGCGTGALTAQILSRTSNAQIIGLDISETYIDYATQRFEAPRASFLTGDLANLPFDDMQFDQVVSQLALEFVPDTDRAFQEVFRVIKPGGEFAAAAWDSRGGLMFNRLFLDTASVLDDEADTLRKAICTRPLRRPKRLENAMQSAGFTNVRSGELVIRTVFDSFEDYWAPFDGTDGPIPSYFAKRPAWLKAAIKDAVQRAYLDGEDDGPGSYVAAAWAASSRRPA